MGKPNFSDEFKRDAVVQITERGYPVAEVSQRLGVKPSRRMNGSRSPGAVPATSTRPTSKSPTSMR